MRKMVFAVAVFFLSSVAFGQTYYDLDRAVLITSEGMIDTALPLWRNAVGIRGTMTISGKRIVQEVTFCFYSQDECVTTGGGGSITSVSEGTAKVTVRNDNGTISELTIISLSPQIATLTVNGGITEIDFWKPVPRPFGRSGDGGKAVGEVEGKVGLLLDGALAF